MSDWMLNGLPVHSGSLRLPRRGPWGGDLEVGTDGSLPPTLTLEAGGVEWSARLVAQTSLAGVVQARFLAGTADLGTELAARGWSLRRGDSQLLTWRQVITDTLADVGETLDDATDSALLSRPLVSWYRPAGKAVDALNAIAAALDCSWRYTPRGRVLFVVDAWNEVSPAELELEEAHPESVHLSAQSLVPALAPGASVYGRRVESVTWVLTQGLCAVEVAFWRAGLPDDDIGRMVRELVRQELAPLRFLGLHDGAVVSQGDDGTVDVRMSSPLLPDVVRAQLCGPVPGARLSVATGARVLVQWIFTGPTTPMHPIATLWPDRESREGLAALELGPAASLHEVARKTDSVDLGTWSITMPGGVPTIVWTPPGGGAPVTITTVATALSGKIASGSGTVKFG